LAWRPRLSRFTMRARSSYANTRTLPERRAHRVVRIVAADLAQVAGVDLGVDRPGLGQPGLLHRQITGQPVETGNQQNKLRPKVLASELTSEPCAAAAIRAGLQGPHSVAKAEVLVFLQRPLRPWIRCSLISEWSLHHCFQAGRESPLLPIQ